MSLTPSNMLPLGTEAPDFELLDVVSGERKNLAELKSDTATVIMFICNHCPYVVHVQDEMLRLANDYMPKSVKFIAISSNDVENYPQDSPVKMKELAEDLGYSFPYLYDESQEVAKNYDAACTPDFYVFDGDTKLTYRGRLDESRPNTDIPMTGRDLRNALDCILEQKENIYPQIPSMGCNIKWKK